MGTLVPIVNGARYKYQSVKATDKNNGRVFILEEYIENEKSHIYWLDTRRAAKVDMINVVLEDYLPDENEYLNIGIVFISMSCWKCKKAIQVIAGVRLTCQSERYEKFVDFPFLIEKLIEIPEVQHCLKNNEIGAIKRRFSNTVGHEYLANGCYYCDAIVGDFYLREELLEWLVCDNLPALTCHARMKYSEIRNYIGRDFVFEKDPRQIIEYIEVEDVDFDDDPKFMKEKC
jgi:hypothetical protein